MARTTDQPSTATARTVGPGPAREANGHGPLGDEQRRKGPVAQPVDTAIDTATAGDRRPGPTADRDPDERVSERSALRVAGEQERRIGANSDSLQARGSGGRDTDGFGAATDFTTRTEQARAAAVDYTRELQAGAAISGGYDLFARLLAEQRRFVDALLDQQRHFAQALLTPPHHR
jgi:hypothetical protein